MSYNWPAFRANATDSANTATRELMQWLRDLRDHPLGQVIETEDDTVPAIPKHGTIIWKSQSLATTFIVHWDGTNRYFWQVTGVDLYD